MEILYSPSQTAKYVEYIKESYSWKFLEKPAIERNLGVEVGVSTRALDAGCGTGHSTSLLLDFGARAENVIGTDISPDMLNTARALLPAVEFIEANLPDLKLKQDSLDVVLSIMMLNFLN